MKKLVPSTKNLVDTEFTNGRSDLSYAASVWQRTLAQGSHGRSVSYRESFAPFWKFIMSYPFTISVPFEQMVDPKFLEHVLSHDPVTERDFQFAHVPRLNYIRWAHKNNIAFKIMSEYISELDGSNVRPYQVVFAFKTEEAMVQFRLVFKITYEDGDF